jgi:hypothetical protein
MQLYKRKVSVLDVQPVPTVKKNKKVGWEKVQTK